MLGGKQNEKKVVVLFGGQSPEYDVSRIAAYYVIKYIDKELYEPLPIWVTREGKWSFPIPLKDIEQILTGNTTNIRFTDYGFSIELFEKADIVFPIVFGNFFGGDGTINAMLDLFNIPYVGSGYIAASSCMDKVISKMFSEKAGVPVAKYKVLNIKGGKNPNELLKSVQNEFGMPVVVKPVCGGSSFGVSLVRTGDDFDKAISEAFKYDSKVLIEEYVKGREFMMAVIGTKDITVSEPGEIIHDGEILDYSGKYIKETTKTSIAANLDQNDVKTLKRYSEIIYRALDCSCYARIDFFKEEKTGRIIFNEINTMPVIAQMSIFTKLWNKQGITYSGLLKKIIASGFEKYGIWIRESVEIPEIEKLPQEIRQNRL